MRYFSMFSGIGGFELGIERAFSNTKERRLSTSECISIENTPGSEEGRWLDKRESPTCVGFSEIDKYAVKIYESHFPTHKNYGDATRIVPEELPDFDLLVGGFPCQAFSIAGKRLGFEDTRGTLFFDIARILREKKPRLFVLENVKGLLSHDDGRTFKTIITTLVELGYCVEWQVLNSKNHGVPQNRERVFIIGYSGTCGRREVFPIGETIQRIDGNNSKKTSATVYPQQGRNNYGTYINESRIRRLTPVECERLQGFPDGWTKSVSDSQRYKCLGNAVTVNVIEAIFRKIYEGRQNGKI